MLRVSDDSAAKVSSRPGVAAMLFGRSGSLEDRGIAGLSAVESFAAVQESDMIFAANYRCFACFVNLLAVFSIFESYINFPAREDRSIRIQQNIVKQIFIKKN